MQGHGEGSRRAWGALLNRAENVPAPTTDKDLPEEIISQPRSPQEENIVKTIAGGFERYLIENGKQGEKTKDKSTKRVKRSGGYRGETWEHYLVKEIKELGAKDIVFDEKNGKKIEFSYPDRKGRLQKKSLYFNEVADFIQKQQKRNERASVENSSFSQKDFEVAQITVPAPEVDTTEAKNPFSISGDLEKSDQGTGAEKLDINDFRRIQDEEEKKRRADADFIAQHGIPVEQKKDHVEGSNTTQEDISPEEDVVVRGFDKKAKGEIPKAESKLEKQKSFDSRFETEFGITEEQISQIEGYERLSEGQQKLVLENLREYARDTRGGYFSRAWEGVLKATGREVKEKNYTEVIAVLMRNTAQFGPKVHEENGELLTDFIDEGIPQQFRKEHKPVFDRFNALAHRYAKTKVEDLEDGIGTHSKDESKFVSFLKNTFSESRRKHDAYESLQESYERAKRALAESLSEMGKSEGEIAEKLIEIDSKVHSLRFIQTEPEAVDVIKQNSDQSFWQKVGEKMFSKENMAYAGLGFVGRMALTGAMGLYAAPVVASAVGGIRSWNKTAAELREKDRMARAGTRDTSGEALNIVDATRIIEIGGKEVQRGVTQKLEDLIGKYKVVEGGGGTIEEKNAVIESIRARVQYTEDKIKLNRINFGNGALRSTNMASLFEVLGEARILLADTEMPKGSALEARLEQYLVKREGLIQTRRRKKQIKTAVWGTLKAGAFALAGRELAEYVKENDFFGRGGGVVGGVTGGTASVPQSAEAPLPKQYGYQAEVRAVDNEIIQKTAVPRTEGIGVRVGDTAPESTPQASSPSPQSPDVQIPNNEIPDTRPVEEVQKVDIEKGGESRPYSDEVTDVDESGKLTSAPDEIIEIKGYPPIKTIEANDHVWSKVPEEGVRIPKDLEVSDTVPEAQAEGSSSRPYLEEDSLPDKEPAVSDTGSARSDSVESDTRMSESTVPDYSEDGSTVLDTESNTPETKSTPNVLGSQETYTNTHGVEVDAKKEHIYELTGRGGEKMMVSYGGKNFETRFDTAQEYVQKNPETVVVVEEEPRYGAFGQKLPPSYVEVRNIRGEGVATIFSIQDDTLPASSEKGIDPGTFTKKVTK